MKTLSSVKIWPANASQQSVHLTLGTAASRRAHIPSIFHALAFFWLDDFARTTAVRLHDESSCLNLQRMDCPVGSPSAFWRESSRSTPAERHDKGVRADSAESGTLVRPRLIEWLDKAP